MMMMMIDKKLAKLAQSKFRVAIPIFLNLILAIILMILSVDQSFPTNSVGEGVILGAFFTGWQRNVCLNRMMQFLSPFLFHFKLDTYNLDYGMLGCPWRIRNTIYRLTLICLIIIISLWMLIILLLNKNKRNNKSVNGDQKSSLKGAHIWYLLYWFKYLLFLAMVILFILDCDGVYAGYNACRANFDITGFGPLVLSLLGAAFTTTTAPSWPAGSEIASAGDGNLVVTQFKIADECYVSPAIYVLLLDFIVILTLYIAYKLGKFHSFDDNNNDKDEEEEEEEEEENETKRKRFKFHKTKKTKDDIQNEGRNREIHNNDRHIANAYGSKNPFDTIEEEMFEPPSWNKRKPTYEQNYS